ncbi:MAG: DNA translocase FtsK 4TM domain-containing protein [Campylobacterota bacterium]|nr:DNA translocase FtsK 4TM domain-containing protein [Campylobacterota bacterium]
MGIATILADAALIGSFGSTVATLNHQIFGAISYVYLLILIAPVYYFYRHVGFSNRRVELIVSYALLFFSLLILQAMTVEEELRGSFGGSFVDMLSPYIGLFGVWVFWLMSLSLSIIIIIDKGIEELLKPIKAFILNKDETINIQEEAKAAKSEHSTAAKKIAKSKREAVEKPIEKEDDQKVDESNEIEPTEDLHVEKETIVSLAKKVKDSKHAVVVDELEENKKLLDQIDKGKSEKPKNFKLPKLEFLEQAPKQRNAIDEKELDEKIKHLIEKLAQFKIDGDVIRTYAGPVVSTFEFKPAAHVKVSKILNLQDDLAMALKAETIRIQAPIPGKDVVGIEIPNKSVETIYLREIFESKLFKEASSPLTIALGKDIVGKPFITDLKKLPHLLIAGTTGSGKSVGINAMILSLLYKNSPDQLRLLMIDPKMLEFSIYNDIPHLLTPVITKSKQAIAALSNMVGEMERRYALMSESRTKNIENYNEKIKKEGGESLPYIVVIIDELADLMMTSGKEVEFSIARLAQMARASGIHLIVATQRPSVDVVTGLIKANLPSRISYKVGQKVDSKIILDAMGAESLLGRGDMLFTPPGMSGLIRLHAPWSAEDEIDKIVEFIKIQREPQYNTRFLSDPNESSSKSADGDVSADALDPMYEAAKNVVLTDKKTSISYLQRKLQIGYNRSANIVEQLEQRGVLSAPNAKGNREIIQEM